VKLVVQGGGVMRGLETRLVRMEEDSRVRGIEVSFDVDIDRSPDKVCKIHVSYCSS
jgi:hypothetical protein